MANSKIIFIILGIVILGLAMLFIMQISTITTLKADLSKTSDALEGTVKRLESKITQFESTYSAVGGLDERLVRLEDELRKAGTGEIASEEALLVIQDKITQCPSMGSECEREIRVSSTGLIQIITAQASKNSTLSADEFATLQTTSNNLLRSVCQTDPVDDGRTRALVVSLSGTAKSLKDNECQPQQNEIMNLLGPAINSAE